MSLIKETFDYLKSPAITVEMDDRTFLYGRKMITDTIKDRKQINNQRHKTINITPSKVE